MLSKSDEEILDERLRNWGRWGRSRVPFQSNVIYRLMIMSGEIKFAPSQPSKLDISDALLVQRAWRGLPNQPMRYKIAKWLLVAHYVYPELSLYGACRQLHISPRDYDELLKTAQYMLFNRLEQDASKMLASMPDSPH